MIDIAIDVSFWQASNRAAPPIKPMDFSITQKRNVKLVMMKAAHGADYPDPEFYRNWPNVKESGMLRGVYQYFLYNKSAQEQADYLSKLIDKDPGNVVPALDFEEKKNIPSDVAKRVLDWLTIMTKRYNKPAMLYVNPDFIKRFLSKIPEFMQFPLWLAYYSETYPAVPQPWIPGMEAMRQIVTPYGKYYGAQSAGLDIDIVNDWNAILF